MRFLFFLVVRSCVSKNGQCVGVCVCVRSLGAAVTKAINSCSLTQALVHPPHTHTHANTFLLCDHLTTFAHGSLVCTALPQKAKEQQRPTAETGERERRHESEPLKRKKRETEARMKSRQRRGGGRREAERGRERSSDQEER